MDDLHDALSTSTVASQTSIPSSGSPGRPGEENVQARFETRWTVPTVKVATADAFDGNGDRVIVEVEGREIAVFHLDGEFHAVLNFCVHQSGPLCEGEFIEGGFTVGDDPTIWTFDPDEACISCPWHNWRFDVRSGRSVDDPRYAVPTFETNVENGEVYVSF